MPAPYSPETRVSVGSATAVLAEGGDSVVVSLTEAVHVTADNTVSLCNGDLPVVPVGKRGRLYNNQVVALGPLTLDPVGTSAFYRYLRM